MPKKPNLILPLLLLAFTSVAIGSIIYGLLWKEAERLNRTALVATNEQAETIVENIGLTVGEIKTALMQALIQFEGPDFASQLKTWQQNDAFVDFAFIWRRDFPNTIETFPASTPRQKMLHKNDDSWLWELPPVAEKELSFAELAYERDEAAATFSNYAANDSLRKSIRSQSQRTTRMAQMPAKAREEWISNSTIWTYRKFEGIGYWIGYSRWNNGDAITGTVLNLSFISDILKKSFPSELVSNIKYMEIRNANGTSVASTGPAASSFSRSDLLSQKSSITLPIGPDLPGWTLYLSTDIDGSLSSTLLSSVGIGTGFVLVVLLSAGLWLAYQSRSSQIDAARKVTFVANVSHELKTPLTTIRMFSELMQSGRVSTEEKRNNYLTTITKESQRLTRLVNNVLDFSRIDRGQRSIDAKQQELTPVLEEYLAIRRSDLEQVGMQFEVELGPKLISAHFDRDALCQILGNLIDNAIKYARDGSFLGIQVSETDHAVQITISDGGPGLPATLRKKRFQAFERGDDSLTTEKSGFGLGLSIAQTLAEAMGAQLRYRHPRAKSELPSFILTLKK